MALAVRPRITRYTPAQLWSLRLRIIGSRGTGVGGDTRGRLGTEKSRRTGSQLVVKRTGKTIVSGGTTANTVIITHKKEDILINRYIKNSTMNTIKICIKV